MAPSRVAENARAREWTQGTSGVGHGENVMATSETRGGPESPATCTQHEAAAERCMVRLLVARQPRGRVEGCES